ncbi:MAG: septal ring lytic transglycosylase RlpA family protein [Deltaproteobacteria bacterium]|nr:septal ring lytic transglycosylase RlpA family protein [Deltaproteobacteria bacterium]
MKNAYRCLVCCGLAVTLISCATSQHSKAKLNLSPAIENAMELEPTQVGLASWYGPGFHGKRTASGKRFNKHDLTCAHPTLPFGTRLKVTHQNNGKTVMVVVNDRGPFVKRRIVDLSYAAAKQIGMLRSGTAPVSLQITQ